MEDRERKTIVAKRMREKWKRYNEANDKDDNMGDDSSEE